MASQPPVETVPRPALPRTTALLDEWIGAGQLLGAQVFVGRSDSVLADIAVGSSAPGRAAAPADTARLFCTAKPLTALCVARAVETGSVAWDDPVSRFLPVGTSPMQRSLTLASLLSHSSGLPNPPFSDPYRDDFAGTVRFATAGEIPPWHWWQVPAYNMTLAWHVLAAVLEVVAGQPIDVLVRQQVAEPLGRPGLVLTGPPHPERYTTLHQYLAPHEFRPVPDPPRSALFGTVNPAHGGVATAADLGALFQELLRCLAGRGRLLGAATAAEVVAPRTLVQVYGQRPAGWGLGVGVDVAGDTLGGRWSERAFGHRGTAPARTVVAAIADPAGDAVAVLRLLSIDHRSNWRLFKLGSTVSDDLEAAG